MSTVPAPLKYLWVGHFEDETFIAQPENDQYSKYDENAEYNPSAFRDLLEYMEKSPLKYFEILSNDNTRYGVDIRTGLFDVDGTQFSIEDQDEPLTDRRLVYWREVRQDAVMQGDGSMEAEAPYVAAYYFGYEGKNANGKLVTKAIRVE